MNSLKITGAPPNCVIEIDGKPVDVMSADLHLDAQSLPELIVRMPFLDVDAETEGSVRVDEKTAATLLALGWMPPEADGAKPQMSHAEFNRRLRMWVRINPAEFNRYVQRYNRIHGIPRG